MISIRKSESTPKIVVTCRREVGLREIFLTFSHLCFYVERKIQVYCFYLKGMGDFEREKGRRRKRGRRKKRKGGQRGGPWITSPPSCSLLQPFLFSSFKASGKREWHQSCCWWKTLVKRPGTHMQCINGEQICIDQRKDNSRGISSKNDLVFSMYT